MNVPTGFSFEAYALKSANYLERLVDADGLPYFNVFHTDPAEAAHDWPDYGDVMPRQWQGAIMLRRMTGRTVATEDVWRRKTLALLGKEDGLLRRPCDCKIGMVSEPSVVDYFDNGLTLYTLATAAADSGDRELVAAAVHMAEGMFKRLQDGSWPGRCSWPCFPLKSLMAAARLLKCEAALAAARLIVERFVENGKIFPPDNVFTGHMHIHLREMLGVADFALATGDCALFSRMETFYRSARATGTRFGFLPEVIWQNSPLIACETCALMDFVGVGATLANHGHPEHWGDLERLARNQLVENQVADGSWLRSDNGRPDERMLSWREIGERAVGAWAGWSSPNHILAFEESLPWYPGKPRGLQNCCGGSGVHALFALWKNSAFFGKGVLSVNMHFDKKLPQAEIRCGQPYRGSLEITLFEDCKVRVRIPDFIGREDTGVATASELSVCVVKNRKMAAAGIETCVNGARRAAPEVFGNYLELGQFVKGDKIELRYPLPVFTEEFSIGNPGFRSWHYRATWKGDTVVAMEPLGNEVDKAYSDADKRDVNVFYGEKGPGPLYRRQDMRRDVNPLPPALFLDDGSLNLWKLS